MYTSAGKESGGEGGVVSSTNWYYSIYKLVKKGYLLGATHFLGFSNYFWEHWRTEMYFYRCTRFVLKSCRIWILTKRKSVAILFSEIVKNLNIKHKEIIWKQNVKKEKN